MLDQAAAIPYRWTHDGIEVMLVTSRSDGSWIAPKGTIERGESAVEAAEREAFEEGGVEGNVHPEPLGDYTYLKLGRERHLIVFALEVTDAHPEWDESHERERIWADLAEGRRLAGAPELVEMLDRLADRLHLPAPPPAAERP